MKKKMLSLALALCLGLTTVPALAAGYTEVVPCKYERVGDFSEGLAAVMLDGKWGFIDKTGKEVVPFQYDFANGFSEGLAAVAVKNGQSTPTKYGTVYERDYFFIDKTGKKVASLPGRTVMPLSEGLAAIQVGTYLDWTSGYIDNTGQIVIPCQYKGAEPFSEGLAAVQNADNESWGFIDQTGKEVIPCQYACVWGFSDGLAGVQVEKFGKIGFIDKTGKMVIPAQYTGNNGNGIKYSFSEGLAATDGEKKAYIDKTGKAVIPAPYNSVGNFSEGFAVVARVGKYGFIDKTGKEVVPCQYARTCSVSEGMAAVAVEGENYEARNFKWGFISLDGSQPAAPAAPATVGGFSDVKTGDYFADPVLWAVEKNITQGTGNGQFSPGTTCNQGQILTFLWRAKGEPKPSGTVSGTQYYATAAQWAKEQGLTDNFSAEADCTRAMVVTYLWKLAGSPNAGTPDFTDVSANADYAQAVAWAVEQGITSGTGNGQFNPNGICNRGQIVTFLYRAFAK